jgi:hypothetical protein
MIAPHPARQTEITRRGTSGHGVHTGGTVSRVRKPDELTMTHKYGRVRAVKTTMELPDALLRETKAFAARRGLSLRQVIVEALAQKLRVEQATPESKPWLQAFRGMEHDAVLRQELLRLRRKIEAEFERVNAEEWG